MNQDFQLEQSRKLIRYGILLFLLGLLTGFVIPALQNPRMGLSSHLEGVMNGMLLVIIGLVWTKLQLPEKVLNWGFILSLFGTFVNWATTLFAALIGAGSEMMPIAGNGMKGELWQEIIIKSGLISLSLCMVVVCILILVGLKGNSLRR
jgi:hydroxylaminobenzene mutase